jgi:hypothetical protein
LKFTKQFFVLLVLALFATAAIAKDDSHEMLTKAFQQSDIWTQGPVKMTAKVHLPKPDGSGDINIDYTVSWAGPDKWRAEWNAQGLQQITILNNGKLSTFTNQTAPLVWADLFESAIATLDDGNPAGPYTVPPMNWLKDKFDSAKKKVGSVDARCLTYGDPSNQEVLCIDPATSHLLNARHGFVSYDYNNYTAAGNNAYPQEIKVNFNDHLLVRGDVTVSRGDKFADNLFTPPDKSTSVDFPSCGDLATNYSAPKLTKQPEPKMSDAAKKAKKQGIVWIIADVSKDGSVQKASLAGGDPDLNPSAQEAVQQYKYTPYTRCGQPVSFQQLTMVAFKPPAKPNVQDTNTQGGR